MPGYEVIGFDDVAGNSWYAEDALHCRTMGVFNPDMMHISHKSIRVDEITSNGFISIEAEIIDYGNEILESVTLNWKYGSEDGPFNQVDLEFESEGIYAGSFPELNQNSLIKYFIMATNFDGDIVSHPSAGWHTFNTLDFSLGDINQDDSINIQDLVLVVNMVLELEYEALADINLDEVVDVLDIVQIINLILN